tara:strand:+ start:257 stop:580 length:324 start_codon:yes stop_codon:yes gene_type:complete
MLITEINKMGLIGSINDIPLFSTVKEAVAWADANGFGSQETHHNTYLHVSNPKNWHAHLFNGKEGFMGGINHELVAPTVAESIVSLQTPTSGSLGGSGSGGGGGGGY